MNWLECLLKQHEELESPLSFWYWAGLASISAVVKDSVWIDRYIHYLYPNIYVMFHAESGLKKGPPISMAKQLVRAVNNTRVISGRSSIQGILKELGTAQTAPGGKPINMKSVAFVCSSELTSSIVEDKVANDILTDLYDRQYNIGEWRSLLKMESFNLVDPTITMLTATNEAHSSEFFGRKDIHGGYFARTFIIAESQPNRSNALLVPLKNPPNYKELAGYLKELGKLKGPFKPLASIEKTDEFPFPYVDRTTGETAYYDAAGLIYQKWYDDFYGMIRLQGIKDDTGTLNRFGDSVLKVAMLLSLAKSTNLILDEDSVRNAITMCEKLLGNIRQITHGHKGISESKLLKGIIIRTLLDREDHRISRKLLMKQMWNHFGTPDEFDNLMRSFDDSGMIKIEMIGNQIIYVMPDSEVKEMTRFFEGKSK